MESYYFTFGSNHTTAQGMSLGQAYVKVTDADYARARDRMVDARGAYFAFQYNEESFAGQPEKYRLIEVSLEDVRL
jgi:hypothetical protein